MPYKKASKDLPSYVQKLGDSLKGKWISIFNAAEDKYGEERAFIIANTWLKKSIKVTSVEAKTERVATIIKFEVDDSKELIKKTDSGEDYIDFVLTDNLPDKSGDSYPDALLAKWADQINSGDVLLGDMDHEEYDRLLKAGYSVDEVMAKLKEKKGIAKTLKAVIQKGKLWVRAIIDKRYKKIIKEKAKGVSLEAAVVRDSDRNIIDGDLGGFTFGVVDGPSNERAVIA